METPKILTAAEIVEAYKGILAVNTQNIGMVQKGIIETHKRYARQQEELQRQGFARFLKFVIKD